MLSFARAVDNPIPKIIRAVASAAFECGIGGPPVTVGTPPLQINATTGFPSAIQSITLYPVIHRDGLPSLNRNPGVSLIYFEGGANFVTARSADSMAIGTLGM